MIERHLQAIARNEEDIRDMESDALRHYGTGPDGRVTQDRTAHMLNVARESTQMHGRCLALGRE
ncbi:hypothetical protein [Ensifer sp. YR511]|uniref:hypothetical protein n=1 Tax=Ensifer sp. YR511 TaxID=1855294 RepID=UPI0008890BC4|nr:hypothetical protein [Ensifer sp. YR511]SDM28562.1 hypothetical protein SAMN05216328_107281 [Ensifer sp. YR511]